MMEYIDGEDLESYVMRHRGRVPVTKRLVYNFLCSALTALELLHAKSIAHRDVKPRNFIVTPSTRRGGTPFLTLIDFGLGVRLDDRRVSPDIDAGTPAFLSPDLVRIVRAQYEQMSDDDNNERNDNDENDAENNPTQTIPRQVLYKSDIWALGGTLCCPLNTLMLNDSFFLL